MNHDEHLDNLLDEALSEYRDAQPLTGMEDRVLRRLAEMNHKRKAPWLRWAIAGTCATLVAFAIWLGVARRPVETHTPNTLATVKPAQPAPAQTPAPLASAPIVTARRATKAPPAATSSAPATEAQAKPAVFPSPTPLTAAEREFIAALQQDSKAIPATSGDSGPIAISEINIKPLAISGQTSGVDQ